MSRTLPPFAAPGFPGRRKEKDDGRAARPDGVRSATAASEREHVRGLSAVRAGLRGLSSPLPRRARRARGPGVSSRTWSTSAACRRRPTACTTSTCPGCRAYRPDLWTRRLPPHLHERGIRLRWNEETSRRAAGQPPRSGAAAPGRLDGRLPEAILE